MDDFGYLSPMRDWDRMVEDFFSEFPVAQMRTDLYVPSVDVRETDKELKVSAELPGMQEKDIDITLSDDMLTISGEKRQETETDERGLHRVERRYGSFSRSIGLPPGEVDTEKAD